MSTVTLWHSIVGNGEIAEANCDLNGDGVVNAKDLKALKTMVVNG